MRAALVFVFASACAMVPLTGDALEAEFEGIVTERASVELSCPANQIFVKDMGGEAFRAIGCGAFADYECGYISDEGVLAYVCKRAAQDEPTPLPDGG